MDRRGFTLVEIMIVVLIIGLLAAIAIPGFTRARKEVRKNACIDNMRVIAGAIEQYLMGGHTEKPGLDDLASLDGTKYIKQDPAALVCPADRVSQYAITGDDTDHLEVRCTAGFADHVLPGTGPADPGT